MQPSDVQDWAERLNGLGKRHRPCFFVIDFEMRKPLLWETGELDGTGIRFAFPEATYPAAPGDDGTAPARRRPKVTLSAEHLDPHRFREAYRTVQAGLQRGDSFLTNLTFPTPVRLSGTLADVFSQSQAKYRILLPDIFVCFSPETFITVSEDGYIESRPMKGTAPDTPNDRAALLASPKEIAEHATIVDLIRNDLSQVASRVRVTDYRYLRPISTSKRGLVQTSSKIGGDLTADWRETLGTTLRKLLPAGSVSGAPKPATLELIRRAEGQDRGYYCGIAGYFDGRRLDTCVLIRYLEPARGGGYLFRSGGGITARSDWREEYAELRRKISLPLRAGTFYLL